MLGSSQLGALQLGAGAGETAAITGTGAVSFDVAALAGTGFAVQAGQIGRPRRHPRRVPAFAAVTGTGAVRIARPTIRGQGTALGAVGAVEIGAPVLAGAGGLEITGVAAVTATAGVVGTGALEITGAGAVTAPVAGLAGAGQVTARAVRPRLQSGSSLAPIVQRRQRRVETKAAAVTKPSDPVDAAWLALQQTEDEDELMLLELV